MQKELQFTLSIIGILIIGGVLLHGMWTIRKNAKKQKKARFQSHNWEPGFEQQDGFDDEEGTFYDDVGVGKARVVINPTDNTGKDVEPLSFSAVSEGRSAANDDAQVDQLTAIDATDEPNDGEIKSAKNDADSQANVMVTPKVFGQESISTNIENDSTPEFGLSDLKNDDAKEVLPSSSMAFEQIEKEAVIPTLSVVKQSESPVYSNVVTQPKPEFGKPVMTTTSDESFGQPPEFLLKQSTLDKPVQQAELTPQSEQKRTANTDTKHPQTQVNKAPDFTLNAQEGLTSAKLQAKVEPPVGVEKELSFAEQAKRFVRRNKKTVAEKIRKEPLLKDKAAEDQMRIDFDESQYSQNKQAQGAKYDETIAGGEKNKANQADESSKPTVGETDVLVLNVRSSDENPISGASLLPMLLTLGFKFGEHDIFHRHVNTNGKGPILFSLTNMFKPGVFDIDNIENFSTYGLSLFMMLPIEGDPQQVFNMMHNAARKLSDEFGCRILDGNKVGLSKQSLQQYVERIREFERRRIARLSRVQT
ncbi:MAG: cell division protein ZipA [Patiriisocius sp.]|jgi:cell division protein ZipA